MSQSFKVYRGFFFFELITIKKMFNSKWIKMDKIEIPWIDNNVINWHLNFVCNFWMSILLINYSSINV
jgi:hypothetical protein